MANKKSNPNKFIVYCGGDMAKQEKLTKKKTLQEQYDEIDYVPLKSDIAKFRDVDFTNRLIDSIDNDTIKSELISWGFSFDKLFDSDGKVNNEQFIILNDYISENIYYGDMTIVDVMNVIAENCDIDWRRFTSLLDDKNFYLLKIELSAKYHAKSSAGNALSFVKL